MNAITNPAPDLSLTLKIVEAVWSAISRSKDGYPGIEISEELAKHGLVIVEAAEHDRMRTTLQMLASCSAPGDVSDVMGLMGNAARKAIVKTEG